MKEGILTQARHINKTVVSVLEYLDYNDIKELRIIWFNTLHFSNVRYGESLIPQLPGLPNRVTSVASAGEEQNRNYSAAEACHARFSEFPQAPTQAEVFLAEFASRTRLAQTKGRGESDGGREGDGPKIASRKRERQASGLGRATAPRAERERARDERRTLGERRVEVLSAHPDEKASGAM